MAESAQNRISWKGVEADAAAVGAASLGLSTQLLAFLIRHGRLTKGEAAEIVSAARASYKMAGTAGQPSTDDWQAQADALLRAVQNDVIR
jgi:hypothetical protein